MAANGEPPPDPPLPPEAEPPEERPPEDEGPPEVVVRRPEPPAARPGDSPYEQLEDLEGGAEWPVPEYDGGDDGARPSRRSSLPPFLVGVLVGVSLAAVSVIAFTVFRSDDGTTSAATTVAVTTPPTSVPPTVTSIVIPTTTTTPQETTPAIEPIEAIGDPILLSDLTMVASGLGELTFGDGGDQVLGRLAASFGQPNEDTGTFISTGEFGACPGDPVRSVRWGPLRIIVTTADSGPLFAGYRLDLAYGDLESLTADMRTLSGLRAGDSVETLETIYSDFTISYEVTEDAGLVFELRDSDEELLLWGPVTSADVDGKVSGIYARNACSAA